MGEVVGLVSLFGMMMSVGMAMGSWDGRIGWDEL